MPKTDWWCGLGEIQETRVNIRKARVSLDDFNQQIMDALKRRIDPKTGLARPDWKGLARELHVSRSTISRRMPDLRDYGLVESVLIPVSPTPFPADDCPQQNPRHAKSPENRECVLGDFLGEFGFRFSPSFPFRPGQRRTGKNKNPPTIRVKGFGIGRSGGI